jgi:CheY-specific phosphatase CheX
MNKLKILQNKLLNNFKSKKIYIKKMKYKINDVLVILIVT